MNIPAEKVNNDGLSLKPNATLSIVVADLSKNPGVRLQFVYGGKAEPSHSLKIPLEEIPNEIAKHYLVDLQKLLPKRKNTVTVENLLSPLPKLLVGALRSLTFQLVQTEYSSTVDVLEIMLDFGVRKITLYSWRIPISKYLDKPKGDVS